MNRLYLLLRDNIQSGPYSFDELLQQQLLASDLIWVEGKSTAWSYPYEIEDLKGSLTGAAVEAVSLASVVPVAVKTDKPVVETPHVASKKELPEIPSKPARKRKDEIELRAEELRKKALTFSQYHKNHEIPSFHESDEFRPYVKENDAVYFVHHKNTRQAPIGEILVAAMVLGLIVLGWYGGADKYFFQRRSPAVNTVASQMVASDMHAAALSVKGQPVPSSADTSQAVHTDTAALSNSNKVAVNAFTHKPEKPLPVSAADSQAVITGNNAAALTNEPPKKEIEKPVITEKKKADTEDQADTTDKVEKKQLAEPKKNLEEKKDDKPAAVKEEDEKKKGLGGVFKGLFKKKKKDKE